MLTGEPRSQRPDRFVQVARAIAAGTSQLRPEGFELRESNRAEDQGGGIRLWFEVTGTPVARVIDANRSLAH